MKPLMVPGVARLFGRGLIVASVLMGGAKLLGADAAATFIREAHDINSAEVALGKLAESKSQTADVKEFARMMVKDHSAANDQLLPIAQAHNVTVSDALDSTHEKKLEQLQKLSGTEFDQQFMKDMLKGHQAAIAKFEKAAQQSSASDVKDYAQNTLPTLQKHMTHAKETASVVGIDQQTISSLTKESSATGGTVDETHRDTGTYTRPDGGTKPEQRGGGEEMPK